MQKHNPPHPGEIIQEVYVNAFEELTVSSLARYLNVSASAVSRLLKGQADLSPVMAIKLAKVLGGSVASWLNLQQSYDIWHASQLVNTDNLKSFQPKIS